MLYMELSYTGSLDRSTRASEHVTVQISVPIKFTRMALFYNCLIFWNGSMSQFKLVMPVRLQLVLLIVFDVYLT